MTPRERIATVLKGGTPDRTPFTFWYHFHLDPPAGPNLAEAEIDFYRTYRPDVFKTMHDIQYEDSERVRGIEDWSGLRSLPAHEGNFGMQVETTRLIVERAREFDVPVVHTVFNTFRYANQISGGRLLEHLRQDPERVHAGLRVITDSLVAFVRGLVDAGADGIYFAVHGPSDDMATPIEYEANFLDLDKDVLQAVGGAGLNIMHPHSYSKLYFDLVLELPTHVCCWSDREAGPSLTDVRAKTDRCLMGGINELAIPSRTPEQIRAEARDAIEAMRGSPFILSPGCSVPLDATPEQMRAIAPEA
jgi:uroporphyrinogen decarboxylase